MLGKFIVEDIEENELDSAFLLFGCSGSRDDTSESDIKKLENNVIEAAIREFNFFRAHNSSINIIYIERNVWKAPVIKLNAHNSEDTRKNIEEKINDYFLKLGVPESALSNITKKRKTIYGYNAVLILTLIDIRINKDGDFAFW
jgi:hypothetical protein